MYSPFFVKKLSIKNHVISLILLYYGLFYYIITGKEEKETRKCGAFVENKEENKCQYTKRKEK